MEKRVDGDSKGGFPDLATRFTENVRLWEGYPEPLFFVENHEPLSSTATINRRAKQIARITRIRNELPNPILPSAISGISVVKNSFLDHRSLGWLR
jgi:hypothetical protein